VYNDWIDVHNKLLDIQLFRITSNQAKRVTLLNYKMSDTTTLVSNILNLITVTSNGDATQAAKNFQIMANMLKSNSTAQTAQIITDVEAKMKEIYKPAAQLVAQPVTQPVAKPIVQPKPVIVAVEPVKLLNFQIPHVEQLKEALVWSKCVLDASDTGTGKTFCALKVCKDMGYTPFIVCPKAVIYNWLDVAKKFNIKIYGISNYEMLKGGRYFTENMEKKDCHFMKIGQATEPGPSGKTVKTFKFVLPDSVMCIIDEAHKCKNIKSMNSKMIRELNKTPCKVMLLSATLSDKVKTFKIFGELFGFYSDIKQYNMWIRKAKTASKLYYSKKGYTDDQITLDIIHNRIFPEHGSRLRISELGDLFPKNQIIYQAYTTDNKDEIQEQYDLIREAFAELRDKELRSEALGKLIRARMKVEMFKMPIMLDLIEEGLNSGFSIAVFVNYRESMEYLSHYFETACLIHGEQSLDERQSSIDDFQSNRSHIIICIITAGGLGISLHDIHGGHSRMAVISPTWSGSDMIQCFGRIHRAGSQTPAIQKVVYAAETYETEIMKLVQAKTINITALNDQNFLGLDVTEEEFKEYADDLDAINNITTEQDIAKIDKTYVPGAVTGILDGEVRSSSETESDDSDGDADLDADADTGDADKTEPKPEPPKAKPQTDTVKPQKRYTRLLDKNKRKKFVKINKPD